MRYIHLKILCLSVIASLIFSCKTQQVPPTPPVAVNCGESKATYTVNVKPILDTHCAATCHSAEKKAGGIDLSNYEVVKAISAKAKFLGAIMHQPGFDAMPRKAPKLAEDDINKIACWVNQGAVQ